MLDNKTQYQILKQISEMYPLPPRASLGVRERAQLSRRNAVVGAILALRTIPNSVPPIWDICVMSGSTDRLFKPEFLVSLNQPANNSVVPGEPQI